MSNLLFAFFLVSEILFYLLNRKVSANDMLNNSGHLMKILLTIFLSLRILSQTCGFFFIEVQLFWIMLPLFLLLYCQKWKIKKNIFILYHTLFSYFVFIELLDVYKYFMKENWNNRCVKWFFMARHFNILLQEE